MFANWSAERWTDLMSDICFKILQQKINKNKVRGRVEPTLAKILIAVEVVCWIHEAYYAVYFCMCLKICIIKN